MNLEILGDSVRQEALYLLSIRQNSHPAPRHDGAIDFNVGEPIAGEQVRVVLGGYVRGMINGRVRTVRDLLVERVYPA